jgi:septal ring factor EnvC (AmiA/AmiB activator)
MLLHYNKLKESLTNDKKIYIAGFVLLFACIAILSLLGSTNVSNNRTGIESIRSELDIVKQSQQSAIKRIIAIETGISRSADRVGQVSTGLATNAGRISTIEQRIETSQTELTTSAELIASCQRITYHVRQRGQE